MTMGSIGEYRIFSVITVVSFLTLGSVGNADAAVVTILNGQASCEDVPLLGSWSGNTCTLSTTLTISSGDSLIITDGVILVFSINTNLINRGDIENSGIIRIEGTKDANGQLRNENSANFVNLGTIILTGNADDSGRIDNFDNSFFKNSGTIRITGNKENSAWIRNQDMASLINSGIIMIDGTSNNSGQLRNQNSARIGNSGIIILTGINPGPLDVSGLVRNLSVIINSGSISTNYQINNLGIIDNDCGEITFETFTGNPVEEEYFLNCITGTSYGYDDPTIGKSHHGKQIVEDGICIDIKCWTVTADFYQDFELVEILSDSTHTITTTVYCQYGVNKCNYVAFGVSPYGTNINDSVWKIILKKDHHDNWSMKVIDPEEYLGEVTSTTQIVNDTRYLSGSATIEFKKSTPGMILNIEVRDSNGGYRDFKFNDGVSIVDAYAYPTIKSSYEPPLNIKPLCHNENSNKRYTCAFDMVRDWTIKNAEDTLKKIIK